MTPRTKSEKAVAEISATLSSDANTMQSVMDAVTPHQWIWGASSKGKKIWCSDCGHLFDTPKMTKNHEVVCPHCGQKLSPRWRWENKAGHRHIIDFDYVCKAEVHDDWQLIRYFLVDYSMAVGEKIKPCMPREIVRRWYKAGEKPIVESTGKRMFANYISQPFATDRPITLKREGDGTGCYCGGTSYRIDTRLFTQDSQWIKAWRRDGFKGVSTMRKMKIEAYEVADIFNNPHCVTLMKLGWTKLLGKFIGKRRDIEKYWGSIKIAIRRGYDTANKDADMWLDHLDLIGNDRIRKDLRNPIFVCPANLRAEHQRFLEIDEREREKEERERERQRMVKEWETIREDGKVNEDYVNSHKQWLGLSFKVGEIEIKPLQNVEEFFEEGMHMHHCVFRMGYYKKHYCLILSAKIAGRRVETIEIDTQKGEIIQSRGVNNSTTEYHKTIVNAMKANMGTIVELGKKTGKKTKKAVVAA